MQLTTCPHCQRQLNITPDLVGKNARCSACQTVFRIELPEPVSTAIHVESPAPPAQRTSSPPSGIQDAPAVPRGQLVRLCSRHRDVPADYICDDCGDHMCGTCRFVVG